MKGKIRVGVVGVGYLGRFHAIKYASMPEVRLIGVVDIEERRAREVAEACRTDAFYHHSALFGRVEAVSIAVPTNLHFPIARDFLERGVHVLLEKPITCTVEEADQLIEIARKRGAILQVGHLERFNPAVVALDGVVDRPVFIESHRIATFKGRGTDVDVILDLMIHDIDIILNLVRSEVVRLEAVGVPVISTNIDIANTRMVFESGCIADVTASRISFKEERKIRIFQRDRYISIDYAGQKIGIYERVDERDGPRICSRSVEIRRTDVLYEEIKAFLQSIREGKEPPVSGEDGRRALEVALKIQEEVMRWQREEVGSL